MQSGIASRECSNKGRGRKRKKCLMSEMEDAEHRCQFDVGGFAIGQSHLVVWLHIYIVMKCNKTIMYCTNSAKSTGIHIQSTYLGSEIYTQYRNLEFETAEEMKHYQSTVLGRYRGKLPTCNEGSAISILCMYHLTKHV